MIFRAFIMVSSQYDPRMCCQILSFILSVIRTVAKGGRVLGVVALSAGSARAHTSEGGFVLLLPTDLYIGSGVLAVALTVAMLLILPERAVTSSFCYKRLWQSGAKPWIRNATSLLSAICLAWLIYVGLEGPRDPLANPLPLTVWTLWWIGFVAIQGLFGDLWRWVNPWSGPVWLFRWLIGGSIGVRYPSWLGHWVGIFSFLALVGFVLADVAPSDPARLARVVALYWGLTFAGMMVFGPRWRLRADGVSMMLTLYARVGMFGHKGGRVAIGLNGWKLLHGRRLGFGPALLSLLILGSGIFDGLNETFWWLDLLGLNPLEFPGRSAVVWQTLGGLVVANVILVCCFVGALWLGLKLGRVDMALRQAFCVFAPTVLPIALGYHFAHYFTSFLVQSQYALAAASDPWARGQDLLGLGTFYVSTGFFNTQESVRLLWLCQAGGVVIGHVVALLLAHAVALRATRTRVALTQAPVAIFMIYCTFLGLWLLASPRGF
ncbi:hypothetical protein [Shimia sp. R10_1]|uniref:hypothetical protein n=1 Tax=Shimia sp. R10_1 TaxID=2821095 RepID=UPI001FFE093C|nr:hypothetical protein [Shimia sp. R10_1]